MTATAYQPTLDDWGDPLHAVTFVVVDLETTGGSPASSGITEIGAVKVQGGAVLGEFQTLVNPGEVVPAHIARLTGISTSMVALAPPLEEVLPAFLEFLGDAVVVAHNAPFDVGFLKAACRRLDYEWPRNEVVDTVQLARRVVPRDEAPNHKLSTLAALFHATTTPAHRALADARATVDVLHAMLERLAPLGVTHRGDLRGAAARVPEGVRRKHTLADGLPSSPGVYMFRGPRDEVLYIGTASNLRRRVRSYFTAAETRGRIKEMVQLATAVTPVVCATTLEAQVREVRLIAEHAPRYNRRSKHPERTHWLRLTDEPHPRLTVTRHAPSDVSVPAIGPFPSRARAQSAREVIEQVLDVRTCTLRLPLVPSPHAVACSRAELGRCDAPCVRADGGDADVVAQVRAALEDDPGVVVRAIQERMAELALAERFEEAATARDRLEALLHGGRRAARHAALQAAGTIVAARREKDGRWDIAVVNRGRLVAAARASTVHEVPPVARSARETAQVLLEGDHGLPEETDLVDSWLSTPGVRILEVGSPLTCPLGGHAKHLAALFGKSSIVRQS